jgi:hypothetical protein
LSECFSFLVQATWGDTATCAERSRLNCEAELSAPGVATTPAQIGACATAFAAQSCNELLGNSPPAGCDVPGTHNDGEACAFDAQCKSTNCVKTAPGCGTCGPQSAAGGACDAQDDCQSGLVCVNSVCATPVAAGAACTSSEQCGLTLSCKGGTCATPAGPGEACSTSGDCDTLQALYCEPQSKVCAKIGFANAGEPCGVIDGKITSCSQSTCEGQTPQQPGTCVAYAADGAACNVTSGPDCLAPAACDNGVCTLPSPNACG